MVAQKAFMLLMESLGDLAGKAVRRDMASLVGVNRDYYRRAKAAHNLGPAAYAAFKKMNPHPKELAKAWQFYQQAKAKGDGSNAAPHP